MRRWTTTAILVAMTTASVHGQQRLGPVPPDRLTAEHREAMDAFKKARQTDVFGPFVPLLWSPEVMVRAGAMGE